MNRTQWNKDGEPDGKPVEPVIQEPETEQEEAEKETSKAD